MIQYNIYLNYSPASRRNAVDIDTDESGGSIFGIAKALSSLGIDVTLVGGPVNFWYDTPRVTIEWKAKRELAYIHCITFKLNSIKYHKIAMISVLYN